MSTSIDNRRHRLAVANAAEIGHHLPNKPNHMAAIDQIVLAAELLADIEVEVPDLWDEAECDWSEVCSEIAFYIADASSAAYPGRSEMLRMINSSAEGGDT